jgi:TRAP-type C4-dicarboxylate transport system substrate-binding protein
MTSRKTLAAAVFLMGGIAAAGALTIKLGSLAPGGSPWELAIRRIASEWSRLSSGAVTVKIYSGGIVGDEPDMVRKMRIGQLNAATMTVSGLQGIFNGLKVLSYPLFLRNDAELAFVLDRMKPFFEQALEKRGFKVVMWSPGGWTYLYSRRAIEKPDDLRRQMLWVWAGDPDEIRAWQTAGFQVVPLASTDIMASLQGGMIDALVTSPLLAASNQWFGIIPYMYGLRLAPLWGATVVSTKTWAEVPAVLQPQLAEAAQRITDAMGPDIVKGDAEATAVMLKYGLKITQPTAQSEKEWADIVQKGFSMMIGRSYDKESYDMALRHLEEYRAARPGQ